jgi:hypothetical protein
MDQGSEDNGEGMKVHYDSFVVVVSLMIQRADENTQLHVVENKD